LYEGIIAGPALQKEGGTSEVDEVASIGTEYTKYK